MKKLQTLLSIFLVAGFLFVGSLSAQQAPPAPSAESMPKATPPTLEVADQEDDDQDSDDKKSDDKKSDDKKSDDKKSDDKKPKLSSRISGLWGSKRTAAYSKKSEAFVSLSLIHI